MIIVAKEPSPFGEITILRYRGTRSHVYVQGGFFQSEADSDGVSLAAYIHAIYGLIVQMRGRRVLMIGCGGGTLATMLDRAQRHVTIVDVDPVPMVLAQRYFAMPRIRCHVEDGFRFLQRSRRRYDAIVVDAYIGGDAPPQLSSADFLGLARRRLRRSGCILFNVAWGRDTAGCAQALAARVADAGLEAQLLEPRESDANTIVIGTAGVVLQPPRFFLRPNAPYHTLREELQGMRLRTWPDLRAADPREYQ